MKFLRNFAQFEAASITEIEAAMPKYTEDGEFSHGRKSKGEQRHLKTIDFPDKYSVEFSASSGHGAEPRNYVKGQPWVLLFATLKKNGEYVESYGMERNPIGPVRKGWSQFRTFREIADYVMHDYFTREPEPWEKIPKNEPEQKPDFQAAEFIRKHALLNIDVLKSMVGELVSPMTGKRYSVSSKAIQNARMGVDAFGLTVLVPNNKFFLYVIPDEVLHDAEYEWDISPDTTEIRSIGNHLHIVVVQI